MNWLAVALGGALGSLVRYALSLWLATPAGQFPWATFTVNVLGCGIMGIFYGLIVVKQLWPGDWRPFLMVGLLGGFTTFSAFALETFTLWQTAAYATALAYCLASFTLCVLAVAAGLGLVHYFT